MKKTRAISMFAMLVMLASVSASPAFVSAAQVTNTEWVQLMNESTPPGPGCWIATYPSLTWNPGQCTSRDSGPLTVGNGVDDPADSINYATTAAEGIFTSESGFTSESDSVKGSNWYSLQANSNTFSTTVGGKSTTGWEQFVFQNEGGTTLTGYVFIQYWMIGYHQAYGNCPAGWNVAGNSCWRNSTQFKVGYESPGSLTSYTLTGTAASSGDVSKFCTTTTCWSVSGSNYLNLYNSNWWDTEFNIFGYGGYSQANFNSGTSIGLKIDNFEPGESCGTVGTTGETNNLNLGTCTGSSTLQYITFSES